MIVKSPEVIYFSVVMRYNVTYGEVIYEVIKRKFRASMEPFCLKISKYVEYLTRVSSEYLISCVLLSYKFGWLRNPYS